jgi:hypothetical protein
MGTKVDIFSIMATLDKGDYFVYDRLSESERKEVSTYMLLKWMCSTTDNTQILRMNTVVNPIIFNTNKHDSLHMKLLAIGSNKKSKKYNWIKQKSSTNKKQKLCLAAIQQYYKISEREAVLALPTLNKEDILSICEELGYQKEEIAKIKKEL